MQPCGHFDSCPSFLPPPGGSRGSNGNEFLYLRDRSVDACRMLVIHCVHKNAFSCDLLLTSSPTCLSTDHRRQPTATHTHTHLTVHHQVTDAAGEATVAPPRRQFFHSSQLKRLEDIQIPEEEEQREEDEDMERGRGGRRRSGAGRCRGNEEVKEEESVFRLSAPRVSSHLWFPGVSPAALQPDSSSSSSPSAPTPSGSFTSTPPHWSRISCTA